jgi:hypothetical protein
MSYPRQMPDYSGLSTKKLEDLFVQPTLDQIQRDMVKQELVRRRRDQLLGSVYPSGPSPVQSPSPGPVQPPQPIPSVGRAPHAMMEPAPIQPMQTVQPRAKKRGLGCVAFTILALIVAALIGCAVLSSVLSTNYGYDYSGGTSLGTICFVSSTINCPTLSGATIGELCYCHSNTTGAVYQGIVR